MSMYGVPYAPLNTGKDGGAKQSMRDECDVNLIVERFAETGLLEHVASGIPQFVDVSELGDFRSVIEQVREVEEYFAGLPAKVRGVFQHDASNFMEFLESGASEEDLRKIGLDVVGDRRGADERQRRRDDAEKARVARELAAEPPAVVEAPGGPPGTVDT